MGDRKSRWQMYKSVKRLMDIALSLLALVILSLVFLALVVGVKLESKGPVFFRQKRIGRDGRHFMIWKFRTMRVDTPRDTPTHLLENPEQYITAMGRFLRRTSLDELPQLLNILAGEMSFVGPRPALWNQYDLIELRDLNGASRLIPGLTGWAQVNGRDELPVPVKAKFDGEYAKKMGFWFDVRIILLTFRKVVTSEGVKEGR